MGTRDKLSNQAQNLKGKVEETVGTAIGDDDMRAEGKMDQRKAALKGVGEKVKDAASKLSAHELDAARSNGPAPGLTYPRPSAKPGHRSGLILLQIDFECLSTV